MCKRSKECMGHTNQCLRRDRAAGDTQWQAPGARRSSMGRTGDMAGQTLEYAPHYCSHLEEMEGNCRDQSCWAGRGVARIWGANTGQCCRDTGSSCCQQCKRDEYLAWQRISRHVTDIGADDSRCWVCQGEKW
jgi:hypothetical protein